MAASGFCLVSVKEKIQLSPNLLRLVLQGDSLKDFPADCASGYIKLRFAHEAEINNHHNANSVADEFVGEKALLRTFTIRAFDPNNNSVTIDAVLHGQSEKMGHKIGPAASWVNNVNVGDQINIKGPGVKKLVDQSADWFFLAGDMTALPAICVNLELLPKDAKGYALIEITSAEDKQIINAPKGLEIKWLINSNPQQASTLILDAIQECEWLSGQVNIWLAGEFDMMRSCRQYFKQERKVERCDIYASSYWKIGTSDEGNKAAKKLDADA